MERSRIALLRVAVAELKGVWALCCLTGIPKIYRTLAERIPNRPPFCCLREPVQRVEIQHHSLSLHIADLAGIKNLKKLVELEFQVVTRLQSVNHRGIVFGAGDTPLWSRSKYSPRHPPGMNERMAGPNTGDDPQTGSLLAAGISIEDLRLPLG
jgi:hypothetical protein